MLHISIQFDQFQLLNKKYCIYIFDQNVSVNFSHFQTVHRENINFYYTERAPHYELVYLFEDFSITLIKNDK